MNPIFLIVVIAILFGLGLLWFIKKRRHIFSPGEKKRFYSKWEEILSQKFQDPKGAIIEADKLLDWSLVKKGYSGTLGEKLNHARGFFTDKDALWEAHKKRNELVHDLEASLTLNEASRLLSQYRAAFRDLGL